MSSLSPLRGGSGDSEEPEKKKFVTTSSCPRRSSRREREKHRGPFNGRTMRARGPAVAVPLHLLLLLLASSRSLGSLADDGIWPKAIARLVPMPQSVTMHGAGLQLKEAGLVVCLSGAALGDDDGRLARALRREIGQYRAGGLVMVLERGAGADSKCKQAASGRGMTPILVEQQARIQGLEEKEHAEAYVLVSDDALVAISAFGESGAFRGVQTLMQICLHDDLAHPADSRASSCRIPGVKIRDWPDLKNRGVMLDISRNRVHTMETLQRIVDSLAALKFNQLQMYTEHTFAYRAHATVWADTGAVTPEEARQLSHYCHDRFITLVPNQQSFGSRPLPLLLPPYSPALSCSLALSHSRTLALSVACSLARSLARARSLSVSITASSQSRKPETGQLNPKQGTCSTGSNTTNIATWPSHKRGQMPCGALTTAAPFSRTRRHLLVNPTPYALKTSPYTLNLKTCTLHPTPYILHLSPYFLHPNPTT